MSAYDTIVIGGGQAGLSVGYHLKQSGRPFLILDASERIGDAWRTRWDSLRLFTPARYDGLVGMRFPAPGSSFPTKDQMADYLESYANRFELPVRTGVRVDGLTKEHDRFVVSAGETRYEAERVVFAMSNYQHPKIPGLAHELDPSIVQLHSSEYRNPGQLRDGPVLIVGLGNSGAEIAKELSRTHVTIVSGKPSAEVPFRIETAIARHVLLRIVRFVGHHVLSVRSPVGRKLRPKLIHTAAPLIRVKSRDLEADGVRRAGRMTAVADGRPCTDDGTVLDVSNVIWCTGYTSAFWWIDLPVFDADGRIEHDRGVTKVPGLYFVGQKFQSSFTSDTITGVGRDARRIAKRLNADAAKPSRDAAAVSR